LAWHPCLLHASAAQRQNWELAGAGFGIHWPDVDEALGPPSEGFLLACAWALAPQDKTEQLFGISLDCWHGS
jgi:hypothetical protein